MPEDKKTMLTKKEKRELEEKIRKAALQIIERQGYVVHSDVPKIIDYVVEVEIENERKNKNFVTDASVRSILSSNFGRLNLVRDNVYRKRYPHGRSLLAYARSLEDIPYIPKERTPQEIEEIMIRKKISEKKREPPLNEEQHMDEFFKEPHTFSEYKDAFGKLYKKRADNSKALELRERVEERIANGTYTHDGMGHIKRTDGRKPI